MKLAQTILAAAALATSFSASALVVGSLGGGAGSFATLSSPTPGVPNSGGTLSGSASGTIVGGAVFTADVAFADDVLPGENFLAAGPTPGTPATLTFTTPVSYISFLWGSPDTYNTLEVFSTGGGSPQSFTTASMGFPVSNGDQTFNQSVQFTGVGADQITQLRFSSTTDAFEVGRFTTVSPIPEPETYALLMAGLGAIGFIARRRKQRFA